MKKKLVLTAAVIAALSVVSCNSKKTNSQGADQDSLSYGGNDSLNSNDIVLDSIAGTYEGTLPAADCPGIKTVLTTVPTSTQPTIWSARMVTTKQAVSSRYWLTT